MTPLRFVSIGSILCGPLALAALTFQARAQANTQIVTQTAPSAVLVELFTSEGCSSCPPADELLRQVSGHRSAGGELIVGLSEHVNYWDGIGWKDPFSSEASTGRQNAYGAQFGLDSVYTPQMVVNGREQFVGSDLRALEAALASEARHKQIELHITSAQVTGRGITFSYSAAGLPPNSALQLVAVLADDMDRSSISGGENSGRNLTHTSVARALAPLGALHETAQRSVTLPLPPSFAAGAGHHLVLFAQQGGAGPVLGVDTRPL